MKQKVKSLLKKMPGIKQIHRKMETLERQLSEIERKNTLLAQEAISLRLKMKKLNHEPINVVFVCHRPQIWSSLKSICDQCLEDPLFHVTIVAIPNKKQLPGIGLNHENYESEGAEEYFEHHYDCTIRGYDYETDTWLDLYSLAPDYLFFQSPYNICRPPMYHSDVVSTFTKLCFVPYGVQVLGGEVEESVYPVDFVKNLDFLFVESKIRIQFFEKMIKPAQNFSRDSILSIGYPRSDNLEKLYDCESKSWHLDRTRFRIVWTPRWLTDEGNCHFFDYKETLLDFAKEHSTSVEFLFRPHPQMFVNFAATGELPVCEAEDYKKRIQETENASIDTQGSYIETFYSSDVLVTDGSSIIPEYFLTGKPIIYCHKLYDNFTDFGKALSEGYYWANNWQEVRMYLDQLRRGDDPMLEKRKQMIQDLFEISQVSAGFRIKEKMKEDYFSKGE